MKKPKEIEEKDTKPIYLLSCKMAKYIRGLKAGIISGVIFGITNAIIVSLIYWFISESFIAVSSHAKALTIYVISCLILDKIIFGIIGGSIFGLIFTAFYDKLPGSKPIINGIVTAILYWATFPVVIGTFFKKYYMALTFYGIAEAELVIGLVMCLFWGFLLIKFWDRFDSHNKERTFIRYVVESHVD